MLIVLQIFYIHKQKISELSSSSHILYIIRCTYDVDPSGYWNNVDRTVVWDEVVWSATPNGESSDIAKYWWQSGIRYPGMLKQSKHKKLLVLSKKPRNAPGKCLRQIWVFYASYVLNDYIRPAKKLSSTWIYSHLWRLICVNLWFNFIL